MLKYFKTIAAFNNISRSHLLLYSRTVYRKSPNPLLPFSDLKLRTTYTNKMSIPLPTRTVLITGCSAGGIGAGLVETFALKNYHVFATARNTSKIPFILASLPNVTSLPLDTSSPSQIEAAVRHVEKVAGKLDVLVNNSGIGFTQPVLDTRIEDTKRIFDANVYGPLEVTRAFVPLMLKSEGAVLVTEGSIAGETYMPYQGTSALLLHYSSGRKLFNFIVI
jgi:NADP-dependent 3-hydroxy acid dehydrogenase YdfG